jgi:hypothetical protein
VVPAADDRRNPLGIGVAEALKRRQRVGVVLAAGEEQVARPAERGRLLEEGRIVLFDGTELVRQRLGKRRRVDIAEEGCERRKAVLVARQFMGLW